MSLLEDVQCELRAMSDIGIHVSDSVFQKVTHFNEQDLEEYNNMSVGQIADLMIDLYGE